MRVNRIAIDVVVIDTIYLSNLILIYSSITYGSHTPNLLLISSRFLPPIFLAPSFITGYSVVDMGTDSGLLGHHIDRSILLLTASLKKVCCHFFFCRDMVIMGG